MNSREAFQQILGFAQKAQSVLWLSGSLATIEEICKGMLDETAISEDQKARDEIAKPFERADLCRLRFPYDDNNMHGEHLIEGADLKRLAVLIRTGGWG